MEQENKTDDQEPSTSSTNPSSAELLAQGILEVFEPPIMKVKNEAKELIAKQNRIYIDLSTEKFNFSESNLSSVQPLIERLKIYKEKLVTIRKQMISIHQRTKTLKKRALHIQSCKEKELEEKIQKQKQEEALIGNQNFNSPREN